MAAVELATGYVSLAVETSDVAKQVGRMFTGVEGNASKAGKSMGQAMAKGFNAEKPDVDALAADVERAQKKITAQAEASARKQEAAHRKVEIAQAKVREATEKYGTESSQALTAVDRLATAQQKLESETMAAADAQRKLERDLDRAKGALKEAEGQSRESSEKYAKGWKGVGQRVKGYLTRGVKGATDDAERVAERGGKDSANRFGTAFKGAIAGVIATVGIREIGQGIGAAISSAGDMEQSVGAIDSVFKDSATQMHQWSRDAASAVGLSANEFNELGTLMGAQLKNGGTAMDELAPKTNELIGLGADLSSMFGGSTADAVGALSSALKGERDPIERYGVSLNQAKIDAEAAALGFEKVGGSLSAEANQAATLSLIMKQTADAHGNFAAESDTFAHKQQVAAAQWEDLTVKIGDLFLPVASNVMGFLSDKAMPIVEEITGGVRAFAEAWKYNDGEITSSGFPGFMEKLGYHARQAFDYFQETILPVLQDVARFIWDNRAAVAAFIGAFALFKTVSFVVGLVNSAKVAFLGLNAALRANPIGIVVTLIAGLVAALVWAYNNVDWFKQVVDTAWQAISTAVKWAWETVIQPVFSAIVGFIQNTLIPAIQWLWQNVVKPVFGWIGQRISEVWHGIIAPVFGLMVDVFKNVIGPVVTAFWRDRIQPAFDSIGSFIKDTWNNVIKPALDAFGSFIGDHVLPGIEKGVQWIGEAWAKVKRWFAEPINWVLQTVWNDGIKAAFDNVAKAVGSDDRLGAAPLIPTGDLGSSRARVGRSGGITSAQARASGGPVRKDQPYLVGELGPELVWPNRDGFVSTARQTRDLLAKGEDLTPAQAREAAGRSPREAVAPMGDFNWGAAGDELKKRLGIGRILGTDQIAAGAQWAIGGLAEAAKALINPLLSKARGGVAGAMGGLAGDFIGNLASKVFGFAAGKDKMAASGAGGALAFDGPLGRTFRPHGPITSHFGPRWGRMHSGTDWAGGGPVQAFWNGIVRKIGWNAAPGRTGIGAILDHSNGLSSYYGHMAQGSVRVRPGQVVKAGQTIGQRGLTGNTTGLHLHGEVWKNGRPVNPLGYLHDNGGWHMPGTYSYNGLREPEAVLTPDEAKAFKQLAEAAAKSPLMSAGATGGVVFNQEVHGVDAFEAAALAREQTEMAMRKLGV